MGRGPEWMWTKVSYLHRVEPGSPPGRPCADVVHSYVFRLHPPESAFHECCVAVSWCSVCRCYTATMVSVPRGRMLVDALADLPPRERERIFRSEVRLLDHLDRRLRRGTWPPPGA